MADPAVFDRLITTLRAHGLTHDAIQNARRLWLACPGYEPVRPCPICASNDRKGRVAMTDRTPGAECLRCAQCGAVLRVSPPNSISCTSHSQAVSEGAQAARVLVAHRAGT